MAQTSGEYFFNIEKILCIINAQKLSLFAATLSINSEQIKNKSRRDLIKVCDSQNFRRKIRRLREIRRAEVRRI